MTDNRLLQFKWTKSRALNTYGYNICSLWVNGHKAASCRGGGYDMMGTVLADWLVKNFQLKLRERFNKESIKKFYGATLNEETGAIFIDGACGISCVIDLAREIGIYIEHLGTNIYAATIEC